MSLFPHPRAGCPRSCRVPLANTGCNHPLHRARWSLAAHALPLASRLRRDTCAALRGSSAGWCEANSCPAGCLGFMANNGPRRCFRPRSQPPRREGGRARSRARSLGVSSSRKARTALQVWKSIGNSGWSLCYTDTGCGGGLEFRLATLFGPHDPVQARLPFPSPFSPSPTRRR